MYRSPVAAGLPERILALLAKGTPLSRTAVATRLKAQPAVVKLALDALRAEQRVVRLSRTAGDVWTLPATVGL